MRRDGSDRPRPANAARTRSPLSPTALSPSPTRMKATSPPVSWTSPSTRTASTPLKARVTTRADIPNPLYSRRTYPQEQHNREVGARTKIELFEKPIRFRDLLASLQKSLGDGSENLNPLPHRLGR